MTDKLINTLKTKLVAAELRELGVTDKDTVLAVAARTIVLDTGALVGLDADGVPGVGNGPAAHLTVADVAHEMGAHTTVAMQPPKAPVTLDPQSPKFNLTAAIAAARSDPQLYDDLMARLAPRPMLPGVR